MTDYQQRGVGNLFPYLDVGLAWAALQFYNSAEGADALPGDLSATANGANFHQYNGDGVQVANANGGMDVGVAGPAPIEDEFYLINSVIGTVNPNSAAFPYVTATTQNPNGLVSYVTIDGSLYDQLYLGTLSFAVSSASAGQTAAINAAGVAECDGGPTTYWMCDGQPLVSAGLATVGTIGSTDPVSVSVAGQYESQAPSGQTGSLAGAGATAGLSSSDASGTAGANPGAHLVQRRLVRPHKRRPQRRLARGKHGRHEHTERGAGHVRGPRPPGFAPRLPGHRRRRHRGHPSRLG